MSSVGVINLAQTATEPLPQAEVDAVQNARAELVETRDFVLKEAMDGRMSMDSALRLAREFEDAMPRWSRSTLGECRPLCEQDHATEDGLEDLVYHGRDVLSFEGIDTTVYVRVEFCDALIEGTRSLASVSVHGAEQLTPSMAREVVRGLQMAELMSAHWNNELEHTL